ncbi:MAG TPA: 4Fe-4S dicluster domain-containing protein [Nitrospirota bacterium]|nr:4Fe-4S dicluster domain-containing protein [Nitrospirota bacterium]
MSKKFHRLRRFSGAILLLILISLPFLRIHGESAFRFDIPSLRLLIFGTDIWLADFFIILIAVIFLTFLTIFTTTIFGRLWCGWLCPQTVLVDATNFMATAWQRGYAAKAAAASAALLVSGVIAASLIGYFVSPYDLPSLLQTGGMPAKIAAGSWLALSAMVFLDLIALRRRFCATVCPYAKLQSVLFDDRTLVVAFDSRRGEECMQCSACVKACPVGIDIRRGSQMACIHCAECVDACTERMGRRDRKSLVRYSFGLPGERAAGVRVNPLITGVITAISLVFLVYLSVSRMPFDMSVHLNYTEAPRILTDGSVTNTYTVSLRNMGTSDLELDLIVAASSGTALVSPHTVLLQRGTDITRVPVSVTLNGVSNGEQHPVKITLTAGSKQANKSITKTAYFMMSKKN